MITILYDGININVYISINSSINIYNIYTIDILITMTYLVFYFTTLDMVDIVATLTLKQKLQIFILKLQE